MVKCVYIVVKDFTSGIKTRLTACESICYFVI